MCYILAYVICYAFGTWHTSLCVAGNAQTTNVFKAKFDWTKDETILYNTIISSSAIMGLSFGSFGGGSLIKYGRRKMAMIANFIAIISSLISMVGTTPFLTLGRFVLGIAAGFTNVIFGKMVTENMPEKLASKFAMVHNAAMGVGFVPTFLMGAFLPDADDYEANKADELWRIIYMAPAMIGVIEILLILLIFNLDPISFCIMKGLDEEGIRHMKRVYRKKDPNCEKTIE